MAINDVVVGPNLGNEFDVGNITADTIRVKLGAGLARLADGTIVAVPAVNTQTIYQELFAAGSDNGTTQAWSRNSTITRTAAGQWTVTFASAHPDGTDYHISTNAEEQAANRDTPDITVVQGSKTANGFQIQITTGDNGGTADSYVDTPWSFGVESSITVVVP